MAGSEKFGDKNFDITREEVERIGEALKCEEFRKLLAEYAEEVSDPANVKLYQEEITQLEKERGVDVTFINPEPGYVIKTSVDGNRKAFLNICKNVNVGKPTSQPVTSGKSRGFNWLLPHSLAPSRDDSDKERNRCVVYDVVFHPEAFDLAENNPKFKSMLTETALDAVENNFNVKLDRRNVRYPKMRFKGAFKPAVIRKNLGGAAEKDIVDDLLPGNFKLPAGENESMKPKEKILPQSPAVSKVSESAKYTTPKYSVIHRSPLDMQDFTNDKNANINATTPKELVVEVNLPLLSSSADVVLDVMEKSLLLVCESPAKYKLELQLPYHVDEERGSAKFDQTARKLIVTLPVKSGSKLRVADAGREDSGVECDNSCHTSESSSGDEVSKEGASDDVLRTNNSPTDTNVGYRTSEKSAELFLKPDLCYSLPPFTCNAVDNMVVFTLHVRNVDASSVEHQHIGESGIHMKFVSVGAGFFPLSYAFCVIFPPGCCVVEESVNVETWDNNVILQLQLKSCDSVLTDYLVGVDEDSAVKHILPEPTAIGEKLRNIEIADGDGIDSTDDKRLKVSITRSAEDDAIEITCMKYEEGSEDVFESSHTDTLESAEKEDCVKSGQGVEFDNDGVEDTGLRKVRMYSESSADEMGSSPTKKGILKRNGRVSRSLSESSIDEYTWSSLDVVTHSGSESCIREEGEEEDDEGGETKKTVRFNDVICRKTFRPNCSILGQKKKNQRKQRNKKRGQERRASESENSEGEVEREKVEKADRVDEDYVGLTSSTHNEVVSEEDDKPLCSPSDSVEEPATDAPKSRSKGKRRNRKGCSKKKMEAVRKLDFKSDLMFDLDM